MIVVPKTFFFFFLSRHFYISQNLVRTNSIFYAWRKNIEFISDGTIVLRNRCVHFSVIACVSHSSHINSILFCQAYKRWYLYEQEFLSKSTGYNGTRNPSGFGKIHFQKDRILKKPKYCPPRFFVVWCFLLCGISCSVMPCTGYIIQDDYCKL